MPLPSFSWANGAEVWNCMLEKDINYSKLRSEKILERHPSLVDSYRSILFDWLSEVSHECKFHRETYHLALDFIDRYLAAQSNVSKLQLQLIGTTCLFLAAKYEEIRPPTVHEFAELTDGACSPEEIIDNEVVILSAINWEITPMTPNSWLNIYMQILVNLDYSDDDSCETISSGDQHHHRLPQVKTPSKRGTPTKRSQQQKPPSPLLITDENSLSQTEFKLAATKNDSFILPAQNGILRYNHMRIASVVDLALLHIESLRFTNSVLTASALFHFTSDQTVRQCTGYKYQDLAECIYWLEPFVEAIKDIKEPIFLAECRSSESNSIQMHTHIANASLLEIVKSKIELRKLKLSLKRKACALEEDVLHTDSEADSLLTASPLKPTTVLLTPPSSTRKSRRLR